MKKQNKDLTDAALLRQKAEELLLGRDKACLVSTPATEADMLKLIHELEVHQIELEMQNEELVIAKEKAELAEEKYTELYDFAPSGYIALSRDGEIRELNFAAAAMLGKERAHLINKRFIFFVSSGKQKNFTSFLQDVYNSNVKQTCNIVIVTEGNLPIYVNIDGILSQNEELVFLTLNDVSANKFSENNLIESEEKYRLLHENAGIGIGYYKVDGTIISYNNIAAQNMNGVPEDFKGKSIYEIFPKPEADFYFDRIKKAALMETPFSCEDEVCMLTEKKYFLSTYARIVDINGKVDGVQILAHDITERKLMDDAQAFLLQISNPGSDENFFESLAKFLSQCLDMEYVCIDILEGDQLTAKTLAIYNEGNFDPNVSYALKDTPCGEVVGNHICCYPQKVRSLFPNDPALEDIKAESYVGTTLWSFDGNPIGLIAVIGQKPLQNQELAASVLKLVSMRAAGKLEAMLAEEKLRESEEKYRAMYNSAPLSYQSLDENGCFLDINPMWSKTLGYEWDEVIGKWYGDFLHPDYVEHFRINFPAFKKRGYVSDVQFKLRRKDNTYIYASFEGCVGYTPEGKFKQTYCVFKDISEQKALENALINAKDKAEESELQFRSIFESAADAIFIADAESGIIVNANNTAVKLINSSIDEIIGKHQRDLHPPEMSKYSETSFQKHKKEIIENKLANPVENYVLRSDGTKIPVEVSGSRVLYKGKECIMGIFRDISERKRAETELRLSEERYALSIEASEQGIWDWNVETNEVFFSEQWKKQIGYEDHELKNEFDSWVEHLHPDEKEYCMSAVQSYLALPVEHFILDFRFRHKDGTYRWIHNKAASIKNNKGKVIRLFGTHTDITESKLSIAIFRDIIEKNPMSIQILNMEGYPIQINPAHTRLFGVQTPSNYSIFKDAQLLALGFGELFERIKKGEVVYFPDSYYNVHDVDPSFPDSPVWVNALGFTLNDNNGNPNKIVLMHENITERKNAEALLNDIIENNPLSIQVVDKEGHTLRGNPAFIGLFGSVPPPEFSIFDDLKSKSPELDHLVSRVKNGEIVHLPDMYFNAHDSVAEAPDIPLWIRALIFPLNDSTGKPERFVFMHENITERKISEQELIKAKEHAEESDRLKSAFLANMSHEIRTPMNGILGFSELLKNPGLTGEQQQEFIKIIEKSGVRMLNIINDIVDISKIEAGLIERVIKESNINEQIEYIYTFFKPEVEAKGMKFSFRNSLALKEANINTDREKLYAILTNLVKNAIKYTKNGSIEFGYDVVSTQGDVETHGRASLKFYVKDTGIGIPKDRQSAIFERFIQADISDKMASQGAGLGLSISKAYIEMLGGKIWVESEEGVGSTFYFSLPYNPVSAVESFNQQLTLSGEIKNVRKLKILIAEDDEVSEMLINIAVQAVGKEILRVRTGLESIEACRNNPDIDLILMDIRMPKMNGYEATRQIRQFNTNVVILAQTAFGLSGDREKAIAAGCNDYISKPIKTDELLLLIQKYFGK